MTLFIPSTRPIRGLAHSFDDPRARDSNSIFRRPAGRAGLFNCLDEVHSFHHFTEHDMPPVKLTKSVGVSELARGRRERGVSFGSEDTCDTNEMPRAGKTIQTS